MREDLQTDPLYQYNEVQPAQTGVQDINIPVVTDFGTELVNASDAAQARSILGLDTPLAVNKGGTGANNATTARANLGIPKFNSAAVAPGVSADTAAGYSVNSLWTDTVLDDAYICVDATNGSAVWKKITP